jgi:CDP-glucose 4,6-dehydratase
MGQQSLQPIILNEATHEILRQYLDCSKARRLLNWEPRFGMEQGLRETIAWYREHYS